MSKYNEMVTKILVERLEDLDEKMERVFDILDQHRDEINDLNRHTVLDGETLNGLEKNFNNLKWEMDFGKYKSKEVK